MRARYIHLQYYVTMFLSGFALMTVEITSSRIVAPLLGSSVFTWTSVIGITLLGLSLGSLLGGLFADLFIKKHGQRVLATALGLAAVLVYLIVPLSKHIDTVLTWPFTILTLSLLTCVGLFLLPAVALGTLSPIIFKLYVHDIQDLGRQYGLLSSLWSLGSILGVFITGFYFISTLGSAGTLYLVSGTLLVLFYFFYIKNIERRSLLAKKQTLFILLLSLLILLFLWVVSQLGKPTLPQVVFQKESAYYDIKVVDYPLFPQFGANRILFMDVNLHSIRTEKPTQVFYTDMSPAFSAWSHSIQDIYVLGAGAYTMPINLRKQYPHATITVSELDPEVEAVGRAYFDLDSYHIHTQIGDARTQFATAQGALAPKYDLIIGDAYNSLISVPWYLLTQEFITAAKNNLRPDGIFTINFIGTLEGPQAKMFQSVYATLDSVFPNSYVFAFGPDRKTVQNITILGVNNTTFLSYNELRAKLNSVDPTRVLSQRLVGQNARTKSNEIKQGILLTDDLAPVEQLMTPIMNEYLTEYLALYRQVLG